MRLLVLMGFLVFTDKGSRDAGEIELHLLDLRLLVVVVMLLIVVAAAADSFGPLDSCKLGGSHHRRQVHHGHNRFHIRLGGNRRRRGN